MASSSDSSSGLRTSGSSSNPSSSGASRRGLVSCLHSNHCRVEDSPLVSDHDLPQAILKLIVGFYEEAFSRLPCDAMPGLLRVLTTCAGGSCLGLVDPVSNIIINTLALLPDPAAQEAASTSTNRKKKRKEASTSPPPSRAVKRSKRQLLKDPDLRLGDVPWLQVSCRSYSSLIAFLVAYFGCLTKAQAISYLYTAKANLLLAVMLIQHDLYVPEEGEFDPQSDRTKAALECAATIAGHPSPATLAHVMSIRLNGADLALFKTIFSSDDAAAAAPLTVDDVRATHRTIHTIMRPKCTAKIIPIKGGMVLSVSKMLGCYKPKRTEVVSTTEEGVTTTYTTFTWGGEGTPIASLHSELLSRKLRKCLKTADEQKHYLKTTPCGGDACEYLQSLDMYVTGIIHNLYIKALKLLPTPSGLLMRSILKAGHCYGCMDPLSNIIVNSIWYYNTCLSVSEEGREEMVECNDVLDPRCLLRAQVHSLRGLTKLAAFTDPQLPVPDCALELLSSAKCNIANMLRPSSTEKNPFQEAAEAAGHPQPLWLGALHQQLLLMPHARRELLSFITEAQNNDTVLRIDEMALCVSALWNSSNTSYPQTVPPPPQLSERALGVVSSERFKYEKRRSLLRPKIERLLKKYMTQKFPGPGPQYKLDTILGVEERKKDCKPIARYIQYNVNFAATRDFRRHRTLFFAEFTFSCEPKRPEFCCPLPFAYAERCYYGVHSARKIVYPDDAKYIPYDITYLGTRSVDRMLGMDLVYFSPKLDVQLAEELNMLPSEEEEDKKRKKRVKTCCRPVKKKIRRRV